MHACCNLPTDSAEKLVPFRGSRRKQSIDCCKCPALQPLALKVGDNLVVTYNTSPHELILGTSPGDKSLGIAAPAGPGGSVHSIPFTMAGALRTSCRRSLLLLQLRQTLI